MTRARRPENRTAADATKEIPKMSKRLATLAVSIGAALLLFALPAAAQAASPWWQVTSGARPSNLWEPGSASMTQEVKGELFFGFILAAGVEIGGETIGCLGTGTLVPFGGQSADELCEAETGYPASETAEEFEEMLEGPYGAGKVTVTGGPAGVLPFEVKIDWRPAIVLTVLETRLLANRCRWVSTSARK